MRSIRLVTHTVLAAAVTLFSAGTAYAEAEVVRFSANGAFASIFVSDGAATLDLGVSRNDLGANSTTFLSFNRSLCDGNGCTGVMGFGNIPNGDAQVGGNSARLNTNLAAVPGFNLVSYVQDFVNGTYTQTPITGGVITIDWHLIPRTATTQNGQSSFTSGGFSNRVSGQSSSNRANVSGTLFGAPVASNGSNFVGSNKTSQIIIVRN